MRSGGIDASYRFWKRYVLRRRHNKSEILLVTGLQNTDECDLSYYIYGLKAIKLAFILLTAFFTIGSTLLHFKIKSLEFISLYIGCSKLDINNDEFKIYLLFLVNTFKCCPWWEIDCKMQFELTKQTFENFKKNCTVDNYIVVF